MSGTGAADMLRAVPFGRERRGINIIFVSVSLLAIFMTAITARHLVFFVSPYIFFVMAHWTVNVPRLAPRPGRDRADPSEVFGKALKCIILFWTVGMAIGSVLFLLVPVLATAYPEITYSTFDPATTVMIALLSSLPSLAAFGVCTMASQTRYIVMMGVVSMVLLISMFSVALCAVLRTSDIQVGPFGPEDLIMGAIAVTIMIAASVWFMAEARRLIAAGPAAAGRIADADQDGSAAGKGLKWSHLIVLSFGASMLGNVPFRMAASRWEGADTYILAAVLPVAIIAITYALIAQKRNRAKRG